MSNSLWPHGLQHARLPCPLPTPGACSNSCPSSRWCHPTISSSVVPFSSCLQSFPASGSFLKSQFFASGGSVLKFHLQYRTCRRLGFDPWVRKISWRRKWQPTPVFLPGKSHGRRSLVGYSPWGHKESDIAEWLNWTKLNIFCIYWGAPMLGT